MSYYTRRSNTAEIEAYAAKLQAEFGPSFRVDPNSYGFRIECLKCHGSKCHDERYGRTHTC